MDIVEYDVIATRTSVHGEFVHTVFATEGGPTIKLKIGMAQLLALIMAAQKDMREDE
jgi:hypothetical protein